MTNWRDANNNTGQPKHGRSTMRPPNTSRGFKVNIIARLINSLRTRNNDWQIVEMIHDEHLDHTTWINAEHIGNDDLYPLVIAQGDITVERDTETTYPNSTAIINADKSLTIAQQGEIIGWHDEGTYWRVTSN